jgi:hypothetical protein
MPDNEIKQVWTGWTHIFPLDDIIEHRLDEVTSEEYNTFPCPCNPKLDFNDKLIIHDALDARTC